MILQTVPAWREVASGIKVLFAPPTRTMLEAAYVAAEAAAAVEGASLMAYNFAFGDVLLRAGALDWQGVVDEAGQAVPFSPSLFEAALEDLELGPALFKAYVTPILERQAAKNASSVVADGTFSVTTDKGNLATNAQSPDGAASASARPARKTPVKASVPTT